MPRKTVRGSAAGGGRNE